MKTRDGVWDLCSWSVRWYKNAMLGHKQGTKTKQTKSTLDQQVPVPVSMCEAVLQCTLLLKKFSYMNHDLIITLFVVGTK